MIGFHQPTETRCEQVTTRRDSKSIQAPDGNKTTTENVEQTSQTPLETVTENFGVIGIIAILIIVTICAVTVIQCLYKQEFSLPKYLTELFMLVVGFYSGQKTQKTARQIRTLKPKTGF